MDKKPKTSKEKSSFKQQLKELEQRFLQLNQQRSQITDELLRLQGEARILEKLAKEEK